MYDNRSTQTRLGQVIKKDKQKMEILCLTSGVELSTEALNQVMLGNKKKD